MDQELKDYMAFVEGQGYEVLDHAPCDSCEEGTFFIAVLKDRKYALWHLNLEQRDQKEIPIELDYSIENTPTSGGFVLALEGWTDCSAPRKMGKRLRKRLL
jgi:hypothetical protein